MGAEVEEDARWWKGEMKWEDGREDEGEDGREDEEEDGRRKSYYEEQGECEL